VAHRRRFVVLSAIEDADNFDDILSDTKGDRDAPSETDKA